MIGGSGRDLITSSEAEIDPGTGLPSYDVLRGQGGNRDTLIGGAGADTMIGGSGLDIVDYSDDLATFVASALSPAKVTSAFVVDESLKAVRALVPDYQLSLAIGKEGQNARLAAKLTGARIDIQPDSVMES